MGLRGIKPDQKEKRLKMLLYGIAGIGKTISALQFPKSYAIDTEKGMDTYSEMIRKNDSALFQSSNVNEIRQELHALLTTKHKYKTLIIDPITIIYNTIQDNWSRIFEKHSKNEKEADLQDFGMRYWARVKSEYKSLQRILLALDMNVIITAHQKDVYGQGFTKIGVTYDSMKGDSYFFDYVFRLEKQIDDKRIAITEKERSEIGKQKFPSEFVWSYDNFLKFYGKDIIEKESIPIVMATNEQVKTIENLIEAIKIDDKIIQSWFQKANVDEWNEMTKEQIQKCINYLNEKMKNVEKGIIT